MLDILGNHDHWRGQDRILEGYESLAKREAPVRQLVDESLVIEHAGERLRVVGVDYPMGGRNPLMKAQRMRRSAEVAFQGTSPGETVLCLSHHPSFFPYAAERGAHLTLAGHTHGGQVALLGIPLFGFVFEYMLGRYKHKDSHLYVSGGTGHWLPFRIGIPAEVTILTLRKA
jgi:predicted MPP superfamily phosphohydrolase